MKLRTPKSEDDSIPCNVFWKILNSGSIPLAEIVSFRTDANTQHTNKENDGFVESVSPDWTKHDLRDLCVSVVKKIFSSCPAIASAMVSGESI
jgi:hypothetical protein